MGWAERLNPRSDWTLREARRRIDQERKWTEARRASEHTQNALSIAGRIKNWVYWVFGREA